MTIVRRVSKASIAVAALTLSTVATPAAAHAAGSIRYAGPTGAGKACTTAAPCGLRTALTGAANGDEIVIETGTYRSATTALTKALTDGAGDLTIRGETGEPAPVIFSQATAGITLSHHSTLSHIVLVYSGSRLALQSLNGAIDHVSITANQPNATACEVQATVSDSLCLAAGANGVGFLASQSSVSQTTSDIALTGDTVIASGSSGVAVLDQAGAKTTLHLNLRNTIAKGDGQDLETDSLAATADAIITTDHCDYLLTRQFAPSGQTSISGIGQVQQTPDFVDPIGGNFAEKPGSPTINTGADQRSGDTDLAGFPRVIGSAPDIGAYEHLQAPVTKKLKVTGKAKHSAQLSVKVNAQGLPTTLRLILTHHGKTTMSRAVPAGMARAVRKFGLVLHGLTAGTAYKVRVVATSDGGHAQTDTRTFKIK